MSSTVHGRVGPLPNAAASVLEAGFRVGARVRRGKPIHSRGTVVRATLIRAGASRRWDAAFLDEAGTHPALVRLSRSVGLPRPLPDVLGLALRFDDAAGHHDLLLATTGLGRRSRFLLVPRRDPAGQAYTSILPYRSPRGPVLVAATPAGSGSSSPATDVRWSLLAAPPRGAWEEFGSLEVEGPLDGPDAPIDFDPVLHPLPGLAIPPTLNLLRERSYAGARAGRARLRP